MDRRIMPGGDEWRGAEHKEDLRGDAHPIFE
jgi:hypothetical protein